MNLRYPIQTSQLKPIITYHQLMSLLKIISDLKIKSELTKKKKTKNTFKVLKASCCLTCMHYCEMFIKNTLITAVKGICSSEGEISLHGLCFGECQESPLKSPSL